MQDKVANLEKMLASFIKKKEEHDLMMVTIEKRVQEKLKMSMQQKKQHQQQKL